MKQTSIDIINNILWDIHRFTREGDVSEWAIMIHASLITKFKNMWQKLTKNDSWKTVGYTLQIGSKCYEMILVVVPINIYDSTNKNAMFLRSAISNTQFSFPWEEEPTLFINIEFFHVMEEFIRIHNLPAHILKIEEEPGITRNDGIIKVVTFSKSVFKTLNVIQEFRRHLASIATNHQPKYYYMAHAFEWLQPIRRQHFKIAISNECYSVFPIILNHLRTLNYSSELNIFDLLSLRLALYNDLNPSPSHLLKFDIDSMIKRELAIIVRNNHLDLTQYLIAKNCEYKDSLIGYLVYEFQHLFKTVKTETSFIVNQFDLFKIRSEVKLVDERKVLNIIKEKSNINFEIDGSSYDRMNLSLFLNLVECHNVRRIQLDTNYRWINDECNLNRFIVLTDVYFIGTNIYNFIEEFISSLKTVTFRMPESGGIYLKSYSNINDYTIFDNLTVLSIELNNTKVDTHMLQDLHKCNLKSRILVDYCTFENTRQNWALLNNLGKLISVKIREDEGTWQSLFEFIVDEMLKSNAKEFRFDHTRFDIRSDDININLGILKFTFDELKSKLEIRKSSNNEIIDLFEKKSKIQPDEKFDYDFYQ